MTDHLPGIKRHPVFGAIGKEDDRIAVVYANNSILRHVQTGMINGKYYVTVHHRRLVAIRSIYTNSDWDP